VLDTSQKLVSPLFKNVPAFIMPDIEVPGNLNAFLPFTMSTFW
jgi:hypothetical protein